MPSTLTRLTGILILAAAFAVAPQGAEAADCNKKNPVLPAGGAPNEDLVVSAKCTVPEGSYTYKNVNIIDGGTLTFNDGKTDFYAKSILVEYGGSMVAGYDVTDPKNPKPAPIGTKPGAVLTLHLYGMEDLQPVDPANPTGPKDTLHGVGIPCKMENCGVPTAIWCSQPDAVPPDPMDHADCPLPRPTVHSKVDMKNGTEPDWFYRYHPLTYDGGLDPVTKMPGYFGYKVIGVSYGGTLLLLGKNGSIVDGADPDLVAKTGSGTSWRRLAVTARGGDTITLDQPVDWRANDWIVVSTTDYVPGHSEKRQIKKVTNGKVITLMTPLDYTHNGTEFDLSETGPNTVPARLGLPTPKMENRAAVALLTRSIRIVSAGLVPTAPLPADSYFGAHTVVRQGVLKFQVQGVEFENMGQGGRIAHYPVHFHLARKTPKDTFVKDTSVNESMTRWYTIHGTHNVTLARNVGWKSIGHGYYLEEGTEIDNNLLSNIGIYARAALRYPDNPRNVPGILAHERIINPADPVVLKTENVPFYSDYDHPSIFWIMNAWNRFEGNMAVGASGCGVCYWMLPGGVSGHSRDQQWEGYAVLQMGSPNNTADRAGYTPVQSFVGNGCSTASMSFNVIGNGPACIGVGKDIETPKYLTIEAIPNPLAPEPCDQANPLWPEGKMPHPASYPYVPWACNQAKYKDAQAYYPQIGGGGRFPTRCDANDVSCKTAKVCGSQGTDVSMCVVTVLDRYTTSFNWIEQNYAAMWLRPHWYLVSNSFITDVVGSGLSFVTGGGYTESDAIYGHWGLVYRTAFIGETQDPAAPGNAATPFTSHLSPFNPQPGALKCANGVGENNRCISFADGISFPRSNYGVNQRMFNIYDGPAYQSSNAYINITKGRPGPTCPGGVCAWANWIAAPLLGLPKDASGCYMPNAAIGWKQPNGFYYPPAFHSDNLYFKNVDIRHYVTQPLFDGTTYKTDATAAQAAYCGPNQNAAMFNGFTDVDRQTELNDDDGSLTGWSNTISVNKDPFFSGPTEQIECASDATANVSPYDYVTSVVFPECRVSNSCGEVMLNGINIPKWSVPCSNQNCAGVPLYRQYTNPPAKLADPRHFIRMSGQSTGQRSTLATNNGLYYIDTTVSADTQAKIVQAPFQPNDAFLSVFEAGKTYYSFLIYAKPSTRQSYKIYVGKSTEGDPDAFDLKKDVWPVRVEIRKQPPIFDPPAYDPTSKWKAPKHWAKIYDPKTGILEVTMDMTDDTKFENDYKAGLAEGCEPSTFCKLDGAGVCGCAQVMDPITRKMVDTPGCSANVCKWAGKDTACPEGGCWGFGFKLTKNFDTLSKPTAPPDIECFPDDAAAGWNVQFLDPDPKIESTGNTCYKPAYTPPVFCKKPT